MELLKALEGLIGTEVCYTDGWYFKCVKRDPDNPHAWKTCGAFATGRYSVKMLGILELDRSKVVPDKIECNPGMEESATACGEHRFVPI